MKKETAHKTDADRIDFAFFYEIGHSSEIRGIVGSVKEDLGSKSLVLERRVNVLESQVVGAVDERYEQRRTLDGHDKFLSTQSENCFSLAYQLSVLGGKITTMGLHGKSFFCRLNRFGWAAFADSRSSDA